MPSDNPTAAYRDAEYHRSELEIALNRSDRHNALPPRVQGRVLDLGCGAGQSLVALYPDGPTFGIDVDFDALRLGRTWSANVRFACAAAEHLPFAAESFDQVFSRVAIPYTDLRRSLAEIVRVLKPGGTIWLMLHPFHIAWRQAANSRSWKGAAYFSYVVLNGLLFHFFRRLFPIRPDRIESFQTASGIARALNRLGLDSVAVLDPHRLIVTARKPARPG